MVRDACRADCTFKLTQMAHLNIRDTCSRNNAFCNLVTQWVKKGDPIYIEGRLQLDQWQDKTTGQQRSMHKVVVDNIQLLGGNRQGGSPGGGMGEDGGGMDDAPPRSTGRPAGKGFTPPPPADDGPGDEPSGGEIPF